MAVALLVNKYDEKQEDISVTTVTSQLKLIKQDGKPVDEYIALYEDTRDRAPAAQLATIMTNYTHVENFVSGHYSGYMCKIIGCLGMRRGQRQSRK